MKIEHIVYFKFKPDTTEAQIARHMQSFAALRDEISGITGYSAGATFDVAYEKTGDYDVMHCVTFASREALETYFFHEAHKAFIEDNKHIWHDVLVINAEVQAH